MSTKRTTGKRGGSKHAALAWDEGGGVNPRYRETGWVLKQARMHEAVTARAITAKAAAWYLKHPAMTAYFSLSHNGIIVRHWQQPGTVLRGGRIVLDEEA